MERSEQLNELGAALAKAQKSVMKANLDGNNPFFKSKYSTLDAVWDACRKPLTDNGLSVIQMPGKDEVLTTILLHSSGQYIASEFCIKPEKQNPQSLGSAITYARRYALAAVVGIVNHEDDDGESLMQRQPKQQPKQQQQTSAPRSKTLASDAQLKRLFAIQNSKGWTDQEVKDLSKKAFGIESRKQLNRDDYQTLCNTIESQTYSQAIADLGFSPPTEIQAPPIFDDIPF